MHMQVYLHVHVHMRMRMRVRVHVHVHVRVGTCIHVRVRVHTSTETLPPLPGASEASKPLLAPSKLESVISACDESAEGRKGVIQTHMGRIGARRSA